VLRFLGDPVMQAVWTGNRELNSRAHVSGGMPKKPIKIEIIREGDGRFLLKVYADGSEERVPIVKLPRKPPRFRYRTVTLDKSRKKGF
jgi:hypothetical protein